MKKKFRYHSILLYASLQFCGHTEEYFSKNSGKCVVFIVLPRAQGIDNILRVYIQGKLSSEKVIRSSGNILLYYTLWLSNHWKILLTQFNRDEKFVIISGHPITFFGITIQKILRQSKYVYWVGDYFPPVNKILVFYEKLKRFYHDKVEYRYYLSDRINAILNDGKIVHTKFSRTVMWGVKPIAIIKKSQPATHLLSVGLIKESQGLEYLINFLKDHPVFKLSIIGFCESELYTRFMRIVKESQLANRVFFPNIFYPEKELIQYSKLCHIGIALYDEGNTTATYYTDPGKIKTYTELGLPVVISRTSDIQKYILQYRCGEVIERSHNAFAAALERISVHFSSYIYGVKRFNEYFYYDAYS